MSLNYCVFTHRFLYFFCVRILHAKNRRRGWAWYTEWFYRCLRKSRKIAMILSFTWLLPWVNHGKILCDFCYDLIMGGFYIRYKVFPVFILILLLYMGRLFLRKVHASSYVKSSHAILTRDKHNNMIGHNRWFCYSSIMLVKIWCSQPST